jgi:hypothetical protein
MHLTPTPITTTMLGYIHLYMLANETYKLHHNSREQNLSSQKMWDNNNVGLHTLKEK